MSGYEPTAPREGLVADPAAGGLPDNHPPLDGTSAGETLAEQGVGLPRLLAGIPTRGALCLSEHLALHGELPTLDGGRHERHPAPALIEEVERAGLLGRGGAQFPTAAKLRAVVAASRSPRGGRPLVVVNGAEGEPASCKDRTLLRALPHLVLDGAQLAAAAVGAREILLGVCQASLDRSAPTAHDAFSATARAISERQSALRGHRGPLGGRKPLFQLHPTPNRYVAGQESALVNHLSGRPALPSFTPPRPFERGARGRPTLVCNVETLAHLALIARYGADWFRRLGTPEQPGSALLTLSGPVAHPGVYEIEYGSPLPALIDAADGTTAQLRAALLGGYCGTWIDAGELDAIALCDRGLTPHRATLGSGVLVLLSADSCPVAELARLTRWLAAQSARQCGPCVFGLDAIASVFEQLVLGGAQPDAQRRLRRLAGLVDGRGACSHPDGAARLVSSALKVFAEELADHARHGPCTACARPSELPRPRTSQTPRAARSTDAIHLTAA